MCSPPCTGSRPSASQRTQPSQPQRAIPACVCTCQFLFVRTLRVQEEADSDDDADKKTIQDRVFEHLHQAVPRNRCVCERDCNAAAVHSCHARARAA
jgi:hypothetical protein